MTYLVVVGDLAGIIVAFTPKYYLCAFENQLFLVSIVIRPLTENYNHFSDADEKFNDRDISSPPPSLTRRKSVFDRLKHFIAIGSESIEDTESDGRG